MFSLVLKARNLGAQNLCPARLRTGLIGGSSYSKSLWHNIREEFGAENLVHAYGMTETSPTSLMSNPNSSMIPEISRLEVNVENFYVSGYLLQKGYYKDIKKTNQSMVTDEKGTVWMRTGDEAMIDSQGEFEITGRIKDMIIRGGENIYPGEIEDHLLEHPAVSGVSVVGLSDPVMGQVVAAFLQQRLETPRPSDSEVALWVRLRLGAHKCPSQIFWMGCKGLPDGFPMTESGKVQKNELEVIGNRLIQSARQHRL